MRKRSKQRWISYVYALTKDDQILYIGKGTNRRLAQQRKTYGLDGHEIAWFKAEKDAFQHERQLIKDLDPWLNRCAGGGGSWATHIPQPRMDRETREAYALMDKIGTQAYCCRLLLSCKVNGLYQCDELTEMALIAKGYGVVWTENKAEQ